MGVLCTIKTVILCFVGWKLCTFMKDMGCRCIWAACDICVSCAYTNMLLAYLLFALAGLVHTEIIAYSLSGCRYLSDYPFVLNY